MTKRKRRMPPFFSSKMTLAVVLVLFVLVILLAVFLSQNEQPAKQPATVKTSPFVTRVGNTLYLNGQPFRFAGTNLSWLGSFNDTLYPTFSQIDAGFADANKMHATVIRGMTLGVSVACSNCIEPSLDNFNEQAFNTTDYSIKVAASYHIHLIIPLVQNYKQFPHGSIWTFTKWRGLDDGSEFYTDPTVIQDYKNYIAHVLNHVNQYTGIAYKDDPTIMAWATGNELNHATDDWTEMIAEYIKSLAPHQLVEDGRAYGYFGDMGQFQNPAIDLITSHFYPVDLHDMQAAALIARQYNKAYYIGEWDWCNCNGGPPLPDILATIENTPAIAGDTFWQLYPQGLDGNDKYSLVYPGQTPSFQQRVQLLTEHAMQMNTLPTTKNDAGGQGGTGVSDTHWLADTAYVDGQIANRGSKRNTKSGD